MHKEIQFISEDLITLTEKGQRLFVHGKHILVNHISYADDFKHKVFAGNISSFSTYSSITDLDNKLHR